ncbi:MAG TPA: dienelactone hydrolase family protein [Acidimicrobiales bacterium]
MTFDIHAETIHFNAMNDDVVEAYLATTVATANVGGVLVIHHLPGYDEATKEITRKFAANGFNAICVNLYSRDAPGASPDDAAAAVRAAGGVPDARLVGDLGSAAAFLRALPTSNGKVGVIGYCSGGRQSVLAACSLELDAAVDCYGAFVVMDPPEASGFKMTSLVPILGNLSCPLLGLFGADDQYPSPEQTETLRGILEANQKTFDFHTYDGAGHAFFNVDRPSYRPEVATEAWNEIWAFFGDNLATK